MKEASRPRFSLRVVRASTRHACVQFTLCGAFRVRSRSDLPTQSRNMRLVASPGHVTQIDNISSSAPGASTFWMASLDPPRAVRFLGGRSLHAEKQLRELDLREAVCRGP